MKKIYSLLSVALLLAACSDNSSSANEEAENTPSTQESKVLIFGSDYTTGELYFSDSESSLQFNQDSKVIATENGIYILERYGADNVVKIEEEKENYKVKWQVALNDAANPSDIVEGNKSTIWVSQESGDSLLQMDSKTGKILEYINIEQFKHKDGLYANAVDLEILGDTLFVLIQRYTFDSETFSTAYPSSGIVAMYSTDSKKLLDTISLKTKNPQKMKFAGKDLYVASQGPYNESYGTDADSLRGIEKIDLKKLKSKILVSGKELGGGVYNFVVDSENNLGYVTIYHSFGDVPLKQINLEDGSIETIEGIADAEGGLAFDNANNTLYIGDRTYGNEKVYTWQNDSLETLDYQGTLPPYNMAVLN